MDTPADSPDPHVIPRQRMLAARDRVRRYFSPEAIAGTDPDEAEVIGQSAPVTNREVRAAR